MTASQPALTHHAKPSAAAAGVHTLSALLGAGLVFAGASGWRRMSKLLSLAPWNRHG